MRKFYLFCSTLVALMLLAFTTEATAQEKPILTFACVSDLHAQQDFITDPNNIRIRESATKTLSKIKAEENVDLIVLGGDYTSNNTIPQSSWQITKDLLIEASRGAFNGTKTPVIYVNGNHEYEVANYDAIPKPYNAGDYYDVPMKTDIGALPEADCFYETAINGTGEGFELLAAYHYVVNGFDFVVLNGGKYLFETASSYAYSIESVNWVANKLEEIYATDQNKTVFFLVHIPFSDSNRLSNKNKGMDRYSSTTPEFAVKLKNTLAKYPNLIMLYGHDHGTDSAYIRSSTEERVTVYAGDGSKYTGTSTGTTTPTTPTTTTTYYIQNYDSKAYLGYNTENLAAVTTNTSDVTFAQSTLTSGAFTINLTNAPNDSNGEPREYVHCGSSGRFSGNSANTESGQQIYMYEVANPDATTITGTLATTIEGGKTYMIVGLKSGTYYALTDEMYQNNTTNQRMNGAAVTISGNNATYTGSANVLWTVNENSTIEPTPTPTPSPSDKSFFSAFMGSMRYYENSFENGQLADRRIIQALMVYVYSDRVELKMKNYGDDSGDAYSNGITVKKDLTPYISYRTVTHSEEAVTAKPTVNSTGGDINNGSEVTISVDAPEWHNVYYTVNGENPTEESTKAENGKIKFTANGESSYFVKVAAQEGIRLMSESVEVVYNVKDTHGITVSTTPANGGTVQLSINEAEQTVTITAQVAEGYEFAGWKVGEETISTEMSYTTALVENTAYVATFEAKKLNVTVTAGVGGTATEITEPVEYGSTLTLTATPDSGYQFENWTVNGTVVSEEATFTTTVTEATEFVANFKEKSNKISPVSAEISQQAWGAYTADKIIDGDYGSRYESWSNQEAGATVTVNFDDTYVLEKVAIDFGGSSVIPVESKLQVTTDGSVWTDIEGSTFTTNSGIDGVVTVDCKKTPAKSVRMVIVSNRSAYLVIYEFDCFGKTVEVAERTISVSVNDEAMGTAYVGEEGTTSLAGQTGNVKVVAVANEGYEFVNWTLNGEVVSTDATMYDLTEGDKEYVANFVALAMCNISVSVNDAVMGTATASLTGEMFKYTEVTFTATANDGYEFVRWAVDGVEVSKQNPFTTNIETDANYQAIFRMPPTKLAIERGEVSMAHYGSHTADKMVDGQFDTYFDSTSSQSYTDGDITATAVLEEESLVGDVKIYFAGSYRPTQAKIQVSTDYEMWVDVEGGAFAGDDAEYTDQGYLITVDCGGVTAKYVRMLITEKAATYLTIYEFEVYEAPVNVEARTISVSVNDATMGSAYVGVEGTTSLEDQTGAVKLVATASGNAYRFVNWTVDGEVVATTPTFVDRTEGDKAYVANFEAKPIYTVSVSSFSEMLGTVSSTAGDVVYEGDVVTFTATAADGYKFVAWTSGTDTVSVVNPYTVTVMESIALVANFERDPKLDRSTWEISASSEETTGEGAGNGVATCIIDGKESTFWHSQWNGSEPGYPHWFMIDMKTSKAFDAFEYVSRGTSTTDDGVNNGNILNYALYTSDEPIDANALENATLVTSGQFTYDGTTNVHKVEFNSVKGRYVMLYATGQSANGKKNASCAEFYLYSSNFSVSVASANEAMGTVYIQEEGVTSVGCSVEGTDVVTLTAVPADKYQFVNWTLNGEVVSTDAVYTTDLVTESRAYVANFEFAPVAPRTITATVNNTAKGSVVFLAPESTESSVVSDNIVVLEAVPTTTDDFFVNWTIDGVEVGTETTYEYLDEADVTIQANFISKYVVTVEPNENGKITVKQGETSIATGDRVIEGENITITVKANVRRELKELYVNGENVFAQYKAAGSYTLAVTEEVTISAVYGDPICYFTYTCTGNGWIEAWESDTYDEEADSEGTLELPVSPDGYQYAYGEVVPFLSTLAIFPVAGEGDELISLSINGEDIEVSEESDIIYYGDFFFDEVEGPVHVIAAFTGEYTGVEDAEVSETSIYSVAGGIVVEVAEAATASIYSIAGVLVSEQTVSDKATIAMEKGVYIVKVAEKVAKVIVK